MTDTHIWKKIKKRFYAMSLREKNEETGEIEDVPFPYFVRDEQDNVTNVIEPNTAKERPSDDIWFEIFPLRSPPFQQEWGTHGRNRWTFGLQINMNRPKDFGTDDFDEAYDFIAANFKRGDTFNGIRVLKTAYRSSARLLDDYYSEPVTVMVQADLDN